MVASQDLTVEYQTQQVRVNGWTINTVVGGTGPSLLFIHGLGLSWNWWQPTLAEFSKDFCVCAIDLPGSGGSSPLTEPPPPSAYASLIGEVIASLHLGPTILIGHSLGGYVALQAVIQRAHGITGLVLVDSAGFGPVGNGILRMLSFPVVGELLMRTGDFGLYTFLRTMVYDPNTITDRLIEQAKLSSAARDQFLQQLRIGVSCGKTTDASLIETVPPLSIPRIVVWGQHDSVFAVRQACRAQELLQIDRPIVFDRSGHWPPLEEPRRFWTVLRSFCLQASVRNI